MFNAKHLRNPGMSRILFFAFGAILPAIMIGVSNYDVFRDSFAQATGLLVSTILIAGLLLWVSASATPKVARLAIVLNVITASLLWINYASHFVLAREVAQAKMGVADRHKEEERQEAFAAAADARKVEADKAAANLAAAEARKLNAEANRNRTYSGRVAAPVQRGQVAQVAATPAPIIAVLPGEAPAVAVVRASPDEVRERWIFWLTLWAYLEAGVTVLGGAIIFAKWEWDLNADGINDALQTYPPRQQSQGGSRPIEGFAQKRNSGK